MTHRLVIGSWSSSRFLVTTWFDVTQEERGRALAPPFALMRLRDWLSVYSPRDPALCDVFQRCRGQDLDLSRLSNEEFVHQLGAELERGTLFLVPLPQRPVAALSALRSSAPAAPEPAAPASQATEEKTFVEIELLSKADRKPVAGARYRLKLADGSVRTGTLSDQGTVKETGVDPGTCEVEFPDFAPAEWGATAAGGGGSDYTVGQGDCLASIAKKFGFADWRTIYQAPENERFRKVRPNPNLLFPGDTIHIPGKQAQPVSKATGAKHSFSLAQAEIHFKVRIQLGAPFSYQLDMGGASHQGQLDDGAVIEVPIEPDVTQGKLSVWPNGDTSQDPIQWDLELGSLDPLEENTGAQARLNNLGFTCGEVDGVVGPKTERALRAFQRAAGIDVTGQLDDATRDALRSRYDQYQ